MANVPEFISVDQACRIIGGDKPIYPSTYYRGVRAGAFPAPVLLSPNIARIVLPDLLVALQARLGKDPSADQAPTDADQRTAAA